MTPAVAVNIAIPPLVWWIALAIVAVATETTEEGL